MTEKKKNKIAIIILAHTLDRQTRATKIIRALASYGYQVNFLGWNRGINCSRSEKKEAGEFNKEILLNLKAPWGCNIILYLPLWWCFVFYHLMVDDWDIAHGIQILSIPPIILAGIFRRKPVIYDILDTYEDTILMPRILRNIIVEIDKVFMRLASGIILADNAQINEIGGIPNSNVVTIYDSPDILSKINVTYERNAIFTLFFAGLLFTGKALNLDKLFSAINNIDNVKVVIAGYGDLVDEINAWSNRMPDKIIFIGEISRSEVLERSMKADLLFILRDSIIPVNKYICGSKMLEAMWCSKPILVNGGTSTSEIVIEENCGLVVDAKDVRQIENAIIKLRDDPDLCLQLGNNAREAYVHRYSWDIMKGRLLKLYADLMHN